MLNAQVSLNITVGFINDPSRTLRGRGPKCHYGVQVVHFLFESLRPTCFLTFKITSGSMTANNPNVIPRKPPALENYAKSLKKGTFVDLF